MWLTTSDGVKLNYHDHGNGAPLIFLAGYSGTQLEWQQQVGYFQSQGYRVITLDHRNHGLSHRTTKNLRIARLAADLAELMQALSLSPVILVGHSMGMAVVWAYLSLFGDANVRAVVDVDESPKALNDAEWNWGALDLTWDNVWQKSTQINHTKMTYGNVDVAVWQSLKQAQRDHPFNPQLNADLLVNHLTQDWRDVVQNGNISQLFLGSQHSPIWDSGYVSFCCDLAPQAQSYIFEHSGHLPHLEEPQIFNHVVQQFLNQL